MITKIISGGQTGTERAALDVAIKVSIAHGGWAPAGRKTEEGELPEKYKLKEMPTSNHSKLKERNILDSDGTLIISSGDLADDLLLIKETAEKKQRPWFYIDIDIVHAFRAAAIASEWVAENEIETLNIAGPAASENPGIYRHTMKILESMYHMCLIKENFGDVLPAGHLDSIKSRKSFNSIQTVDEAVAQVISELPIKDRTTISNLTAGELNLLYASLGPYIENSFGLLGGNKKLIEDCHAINRKDELQTDSAAGIIIYRLWERLQKTHKLRVIK
jgi:hypothetical protein